MYSQMQWCSTFAQEIKIDIDIFFFLGCLSATDVGDHFDYNDLAIRKSWVDFFRTGPILPWGMHWSSSYLRWFLITWPRYCSLRHLTMLMISGVIIIHLRTSMYVTLSVYGILRILLYSHSSKAWSLDIGSSFKAQVSTPYRRTV